MSSVLRAITRFLSEKVGWHRFGIVVSITIVAIAALRPIPQVAWPQRQQGPHRHGRRWSIRDVALAALFVAAGYFTLTFYDLFALRTIGRKDVPYRTGALAGFTSYSIGHNVGASVFTGGAVRYHIYSTWGLNAVEVAKICFIAGLTFWLGNATVLGLGIAYEPEAAAAIDQLPIWLNRTFGNRDLAGARIVRAWVWTAPRDDRPAQLGSPSAGWTADACCRSSSASSI